MQIAKIDSLPQNHNPRFGEIEGDGSVFTNHLRNNREAKIKDFYQIEDLRRLANKAKRINELLKSVEGKNLSFVEKIKFNIEKLAIKLL